MLLTQLLIQGLGRKPSLDRQRIRKRQLLHCRLQCLNLRRLRLKILTLRDALMPARSVGLIGVLRRVDILGEGICVLRVVREFGKVAKLGLMKGLKWARNSRWVQLLKLPPRVFLSSLPEQVVHPAIAFQQFC